MTDLTTVSVETVFDAIAGGLGMVDSARRVVMMNRAPHEVRGSPPVAFPP